MKLALFYLGCKDHMTLGDLGLDLKKTLKGNINLDSMF